MPGLGNGGCQDPIVTQKEGLTAGKAEVQEQMM